ncbi:hypothetical protein DFAR_3800033 [Desulfarculales bacterium]
MGTLPAAAMKAGSAASKEKHPCVTPAGATKPSASTEHLLPKKAVTMAYDNHSAAKIWGKNGN